MRCGDCEHAPLPDGSTHILVFAIRPVAAGETFTRANVDVMRRGKQPAGLEPSEMAWVPSSVAARDIRPGQALRRDDVTP
jgi:sialic acid synthase SpsE